jgi:hypothetical protein
MNKMKINQKANASLVRGGRVQRPNKLPPLASGVFEVDHYRDGKRIGSYRFKNGITDEGKDKLLDVMFDDDTQISSWFLGLIDDVGFTALADDDTYAGINDSNGWDEFDDYTDPANADSGTTRPAWTNDAASDQAITNSSVVSFDITASGTVKGLFLVGGGTDPEIKNNSAGGGVLWATALFTGGDVPVQNNDTLRVTYTVSA